MYPALSRKCRQPAMKGMAMHSGWDRKMFWRNGDVQKQVRGEDLKETMLPRPSKNAQTERF